MRHGRRSVIGIACALALTGCDKVAVAIAEALAPIVFVLVALVAVGVLIFVATVIAGIVTLIRGHRRPTTATPVEASIAGVLNSAIGLAITTGACSELIDGRTVDTAAVGLVFGSLVLTLGVANLWLARSTSARKGGDAELAAVSAFLSIGITLYPGLILTGKFGSSLPVATSVVVLIVLAIATAGAHARSRLRGGSALSISPSLIPVVFAAWLVTFYAAGYLRAQRTCTTGLCKDNSGCSVSPEGFGFACHIPLTACDSTCQTQGKCTLKDGGCIAESTKDCQHSLLCPSHGQCTAQNGACVAQGDDCKASRDCMDLGRCNAENGACVLSDESCMRGEPCREEGKCKLSDGQCVVTEEGCNASTVCTREGLCSSWFGRCQAFSFRDCEKSEACSKHGRCRERNHVCVE